MSNKPTRAIFHCMAIPVSFFFLVAGFFFTGAFVVTGALILGGVFLAGGGTAQTYKIAFMHGQFDL